MARTLEELENELRALPHDDRARLAHELLVSLEGEEAQFSKEAWSAAWGEEIRRRVEEVERGDVELVSAEEALKSARERVVRPRPR